MYLQLIKIRQMNKKDLVDRTDYLISQGKRVIETRVPSQFTGPLVNIGMQEGFRTAALSFIKNLYGEGHPYFTEFDERVRGEGVAETEIGINILFAIRKELEDDWLVSIKQLVSADIFSDFLEMSKYLLDQRYKDPAAVMIGSVLEEHLRILCSIYSVDVTVLKHGVPVHKNADTINADLVKVSAYGVLEQKSVTAWLDLRNRAAHGKYSEYTQEQVELMYHGVLNFLITVK